LIDGDDTLFNVSTGKIFAATVCSITLFAQLHVERPINYFLAHYLQRTSDPIFLLQYKY